MGCSVSKTARGAPRPRLNPISWPMLGGRVVTSLELSSTTESESFLLSRPGSEEPEQSLEPKNLMKRRSEEVGSWGEEVQGDKA